MIKVIIRYPNGIEGSWWVDPKDLSVPRLHESAEKDGYEIRELVAVLVKKGA